MHISELYLQLKVNQTKGQFGVWSEEGEMKEGVCNGDEWVGSERTRGLGLCRG